MEYPEILPLIETLNERKQLLEAYKEEFAKFIEEKEFDQANLPSHHIILTIKRIIKDFSPSNTRSKDWRVCYLITKPMLALQNQKKALRKAIKAADLRVFIMTMERNKKTLDTLTKNANNICINGLPLPKKDRIEDESGLKQKEKLENWKEYTESHSNTKEFNEIKDKEDKQLNKPSRRPTIKEIIETLEDYVKGE